MNKNVDIVGTNGIARFKGLGFSLLLSAPLSYLFYFVIGSAHQIKSKRQDLTPDPGSLSQKRSIESVSMAALCFTKLENIVSNLSSAIMSSILEKVKDLLTV